MTKNSDYIKILIAGEGGVGKTTLTRSYMEGQFIANLGITIGVSFFTKEITIENSTYTLQIWDFGGQKRFRPLLPDFISGTAGVLYLFALPRLGSLVDNISKWVSIFRAENPSIPILLIGSKCDLEYQIDDNMVEYFKNVFGMFDYLKVSSLKMINVDLVFRLLAKEIIKNKEINNTQDVIT